MCKKIDLICSNCGDVKTMYKSEKLRKSSLCKKCHIDKEKKMGVDRRESLRLSTHLICPSCKKEKSTSEFYLNGQNRKCKDCMPYNKKVEQTCVKCGLTRVVSLAASVKGSGLCKWCAQKIAANKPETKQRKSLQAREQVLRQGGVPNAKKFTKDQAKENHYNWKGGITPEVMRIRNSEETAIWRKAVFERDDYTCQGCGQRGGRLHCHHVKEFSKYPELRFEVSNGQTLCVSCHTKTHNYGRKKQLSVA